MCVKLKFKKKKNQMHNFMKQYDLRIWRRKSAQDDD